MLKIMLAAIIILTIWQMSPMRDSNGAGPMQAGGVILDRAGTAGTDPRVIAAGLEALNAVRAPAHETLPPGDPRPRH